MKHVKLFAAALLLSAAPAVVHAQAANQPMAMRDAIEIAIASNPEILQAQFNFRRVPAGWKTARGAR
jgi:adhesin transport system outer membrane protein